MRLKYVCMYYVCNVYNVQVVEYAQFYINMQDNNKNEYSVCNNLSLRFHSRYFLFWHNVMHVSSMAPVHKWKRNDHKEEAAPFL